MSCAGHSACSQARFDYDVKRVMQLKESRRNVLLRKASRPAEGQDPSRILGYGWSLAAGSRWWCGCFLLSTIKCQATLGPRVSPNPAMSGSSTNWFRFFEIPPSIPPVDRLNLNLHLCFFRTPEMSGALWHYWVVGFPMAHKWLVLRNFKSAF